jgi:hypothetical protein
VKDGETYLIENHQARRIDEQRIPEGQMLNLKGQLVPLPAEVRGFDAEEVSASAATTSAAAATTNPETTGITIRAGSLFHIRDGRATRFNPNTLGSTLMMTLDGRHVPLPENIEFIRSPQDNSAAGNPAKR